MALPPFASCLDGILIPCINCWGAASWTWTSKGGLSWLPPQRLIGTRKVVNWQTRSMFREISHTPPWGRGLRDTIPLTGTTHADRFAEPRNEKCTFSRAVTWEASLTVRIASYGFAHSCSNCSLSYYLFDFRDFSGRRTSNMLVSLNVVIKSIRGFLSRT